MPLYPLVPLLYVAVSVLIVTYTVIERPTESLLAVATVLVGVPLYLFWGLNRIPRLWTAASFRQHP